MAFGFSNGTSGRSVYAQWFDRVLSMCIAFGVALIAIDVSTHQGTSARVDERTQRLSEDVAEIRTQVSRGILPGAERRVGELEQSIKEMQQHINTLRYHNHPAENGDGGGP